MCGLLLPTYNWNFTLPHFLNSPFNKRSINRWARVPAFQTADRSMNGQWKMWRVWSVWTDCRRPGPNLNISATAAARRQPTWGPNNTRHSIVQSTLHNPHATSARFARMHVPTYWRPDRPTSGHLWIHTPPGWVITCQDHISAQVVI